jgi:hypothetical protein
VTLPFPAKDGLRAPPGALRDLPLWPLTAESRDLDLGGAMAGVMAPKKQIKSPDASKECAVSARLRAMVEDVERWPVPEALLQVVENLEELAAQDPEP